MAQTTIWRGATWRTHTRRRRARRSTVWRPAGRVLLAYRAAPLAIRIVIALVLLVTVWAALNWVVQVARKPSEVLEGSGNPVARTYWWWRFSWNPFEVYRPASSAVGMFQITDGTFAEARRYCIHDHVSSRTALGTTRDRAGSTGSTRACGARARGGNDRSAAGSYGRAHSRTQPHRHCLGAAASEPRGSRPPVREWGRQRIRAPRIPAQTRPAMRRPRCPPLPGRGQRAEAAVRAACRVWLTAVEQPLLAAQANAVT